MNNQRRITVAACALFIMLGFVVNGVSRIYEEDESLEKPKEDESVFSDVTEPDYDTEEYTLKIQDGVVVVFSEADNLRPIIVTDIYAGTLRNLDREKLNAGLSVNGEIELQKILEDYSS